MARYTILVSFPAEGWVGPSLLPWEPGLIGGGRLALRAYGESTDGDAAGPATREWMACGLRQIERIRYCALADRTARPCFRIDMVIRGVGTVAAYTSVPCLRYLERRGIPVTIMEEPDGDACRALWSELRDGAGDLSGRVCDLVNVTTVWLETDHVSLMH